jgi:hypothetical protein
MAFASKSYFHPAHNSLKLRGLWCVAPQCGLYPSWIRKLNQLVTALVDWVQFSVYIPFPGQNPPDGYLFICSSADFQTGRGSFRWPDRPAYWSLDCTGSEPLSAEEASCLGFPSIQLTTRIGVKFWDETVYAGVRKFHAAKGFDPDSQDVARELGYPLYELSVPVPDRKKLRIVLSFVLIQFPSPGARFRTRPRSRTRAFELAR